MFFKNLCLLVLWTRVALALEGLIYVVQYTTPGHLRVRRKVARALDALKRTKARYYPRKEKDSNQQLN